MNGIVKEQQHSLAPSSYLGKRKRSPSPEKLLTNGDTNAHRSDSNIDNIIREIKSYAVATSILEQPLPQPTADRPASKKQKTDIKDDTVEGRLALGSYTHTDDLLADLRQAIAEKKKDLPQLNGHNEKNPASELRSLEKILEQYDRPATSHDTAHATAFGSEVLTVRSVVDGGAPKQLFTGLRIPPADGVKAEEIDVRKLPSGFDVVEAMAVDTSRTPATREARTFGDIFKQIRNYRQLEPPRSSRGTPSTQLSFEKPFETSASINKDDFRVAALSAGSWLEYATSPFEPGRQLQQRPRLSKQDPQALFKASFSSFAPSEDNTYAVIPRSNRSRQWYRKYGVHAMHRIVASEDPSTSMYPEIDDNYQQLIDEYEPTVAITDAELPQPDTADGEKEILDEISELLQTLSSYHQIRDLEKNRTYNVPVKPSGPEVDTFELLRQQLSVLVAALPPATVARLDGDQLKALNISTSILVHSPEITGTGQPDEGTLQRQRDALAQQAAMTRPSNPPPVRNSYTSSTQAASYTNPTRAYSGNTTQTPSMPGYAQRNAQMYNTPRPNVPPATTPYSQMPSYQRPQQPYPGATIQQYQRMQNGYGQNVQSPYQQRPAQAPFQVPGQIQSTMQPGRSASPAKPMVNGQMYTPQSVQQQTAQPQRTSSSTPTLSTSLLQGPYAQANSHATIQQIKAAQQAGQMQAQSSQSQSPQPQATQGVQPTSATNLQVQQQRQASGTPQPSPQSQTPQQQHANMAAATNSPSGGNALDAVPGQIGPTVQASQQQAQHVTPTPAPVAAAVGGA